MCGVKFLSAKGMKFKKIVNYRNIKTKEDMDMNKIIYAFAAAMAICAAMGAYSESAARDLTDNVTRLHIIANSDSAADQAVKLKVRDAVLQNADEHTDTDDIEKIAEKTLRENGFTYDARAYEGKFGFPEKTYKDMTFPAGEYEGVRVVLGAGAGKNWWCVLNPPLCFTEDNAGAMSGEGKAKLKNALRGETYELITQKPQIRFKIVELLGELKIK